VAQKLERRQKRRQNRGKLIQHTTGGRPKGCASKNRTYNAVKKLSQSPVHSIAAAEKPKKSTKKKPSIKERKHPQDEDYRLKREGGPKGNS